MISRATVLVAAILAMFFACPLLSGCGGGTGMTSSASGSGAITLPTPTLAATTPSPALYSPNYRSSLTTLRHWGKSLLKVAYTPPSTDPTGSHTTAVVTQAINAWNSQVSGSVRLQLVTSGDNPDITIGFVAKGTFGPSIIGLTNVTYSKSTQLMQTASTQIDQGVGDEYLADVIAHELGHAMGIDGHSPDPKDLMFATAHDPWTVTVSDRNTLLLAYNGGKARTPIQVPDDLITVTIWDHN